jgi:glycosyltransferase involved in cell wall biosynthesis
MGGSQRQAVHLAKFLRSEENYEVKIMAFFDGGPIKDIIIRNGIPLEICSPGLGKNKIKRLIKLIRFILRIRIFRPHVLMPFNDFPNKVCGAVWTLTGAKSCIWNQRDEGREITGGFLERLAIKRTPVFVSNSEEGKKFLSEKFKINPGSITIIQNGIKLDSPKFSDVIWRKRLEIDKNSFAAVMVANLTKYKDHKTLLEAWKLVIENASPLSHPILILAGKNCETYKGLKDYVNAGNMADYVRFLGFVDDIPGLLSACDLGVFSSKLEGCPNGVLECMAAGLPVVAADITGTREALGAEYPFLVPADDPGTFAEAISRFFENRDLRSRCGNQNRERILNFFSLERMYKEYVVILKEIV